MTVHYDNPGLYCNWYLILLSHILDSILPSVRATGVSVDRALSLFLSAVLHSDLSFYFMCVCFMSALHPQKDWL